MNIKTLWSVGLRSPDAESEEKMYVYITSESHLYTVGFYRPDGRWEPESDHRSIEDAAARVHYLNGGGNPYAGAPAGRAPAVKSEK